MRNNTKSLFGGFTQLQPVIQETLILSTLVVLILIYLNPTAGSAIIAFLLALKSFLGGDKPEKKGEQRDQQPTAHSGLTHTDAHRCNKVPVGPQASKALNNSRRAARLQHGKASANTS